MQRNIFGIKGLGERAKERVAERNKDNSGTNREIDRQTDRKMREIVFVSVSER